VILLGQKLNFEVDKFQMLEESENSQLAKLRMWIVSPGDNRHSIPISWEAIQDAKESLVGKPVLAHHDKIFNKFGGHDKDELAVGVVLRSEDIFEEVDSDGKQWLVADSWLWKKYYPNIIDVLRNGNGETAISMEIEVLNGKNNGDGFEDISLFSFMGVTLIGCEPAIPNARAEVLQFSKMVKETEEIVFGSGYRGIDFTIPSTVKDNSSRGLELYEANKRGGNGFSLSMARYLSTKQTIEPSRVGKLYKSLKNKSKQNLTENSDAHISFMLLGGGDSLSWCKELMSSMESADNSMSHFTFNTGNSMEMEENNLKKNKEEFAKEEEAVEKMAEEVAEPQAEEKMAVEEDAKEEVKEEEKMAVEPVEEKMGESQEDEAKEPVEEEVNEKPSEEDKEEARMSLDGYGDVGAALTMLGMETETNRDLASQYVSPEAGKQFSIMVSEVKKLYEQNISLKEFKAGIEKQQFSHIVESTLAEVSEIMPKAKLDECKLNSANFTLENISGWQNEVKAIAFTFSKDGKQKKNDDGINRFALPFVNLPKKEKIDSLWG
jgi:hypothetical protein